MHIKKIQCFKDKGQYTEDFQRANAMERKAFPALITCRKLCTLTPFFALQLKMKSEEAF